MHWMAFDDCLLPQGNIKLQQQQQQNDLLKKTWKLHSMTKIQLIKTSQSPLEFIKNLPYGHQAMHKNR